MPIGDIYQMTLVGQLQGQTIENVLHYRVRSDADSTAFANGFESFANGILMPAAAECQSLNFKWTQVRVQRIWPLPALIAQEYSEGIFGNDPANSLPAEVALVVTKQSFLAGRANRGRFYLAGLPVNSVEVVSGRYTDDLMLLAQNFAATLYQLVPSLPVGGTLEPVIYHRTTHTATDVATCVARNIPRAQRRRQVGRGI